MAIQKRFQKGSIRPGVSNSHTFHEEKIETRHPASTYKLIKKTTDPDPDVRWRGIRDLKILKSEDPMIFNVLADRAIKDSNVLVRVEAVLGLAEMKLDKPEAIRKAIEVLTEAKKDPKLWVRQVAEQWLKSLRMRVKDKRGQY